jgi:hypothetical protein
MTMTRTRQDATGAAGLRRARGRASVLLLGGVATALVAGLGVPAASADALAGVPGSTLTVTGTVERLELDDFDAPEHGHEAVTVVNSDRGPVQVPASALEHVPDGATVRVGLRSSADHRVDRAGVHPLTARSAAVSDDPEAGPEVAGVQVVAAPTGSLTDTGAGATTVSTAAATSVHSVLVVVATPAGGSASSVSASDVAATVNGSVDSYWREVTGGSIGFSATAYPSVVSTSSTPCSSGSVASSFTFWDEVKSKTGFTEGPGKHLLVYFRTLSACGGIAGLGTIGSDLSSGGLVWSNGYNTTGVIGHELGHNLSLGHSQTVSCTASGVRVTDAPASSCTERSYADTNDIMAVSWQNQGFLNASHLRSLGLLGGASEAAPTDNGTITLDPLAAGTGTRALTLTAGTERYVVEYRAATGQDAWMAGLAGWGSVGVTVRREYDTTKSGASGFSARESFLLDGDPGTDDASFGALYPTLRVGQWVDLAGGNLGLRVVSQSSAGAVVEYRNGPPGTDTRYVAPPKPVLTVPVVKLMTGSVKRTSSGPVVPARWSWTVTTPATDTTAATVTSKKADVRARASTSGNPWAYRATATAVDGSVVTATGTAKGRYRTESPSSYVRYSKGWSKLSTSSGVGSAVRATSTRYAKVTLKVSGRGFGLLLQRGSKNGVAAIYVDGVKVAQLNLRSSSTATRVVFAKAFPKYGTHTVVIKNLSSGSRGRLAFDGLVRI